MKMKTYCMSYYIKEIIKNSLNLCDLVKDVQTYSSFGESINALGLTFVNLSGVI